MKLLILTLLFIATCSSALIVHDCTEPTHQAIDNVGFVGNGTGVYLKNGYVITNAHVGCNVFVDSKNVKHRPDYSSLQILENADGTQTDIALFKIDNYDNFSELPLTLEIQNKQEIILIGSGYGIKEKLLLNDKFLLGYSTDLTRKMRLGFNSIILVPNLVTISNYTTNMFKSVFLPGPNNAQATPGDSGGAAIVLINGQPELAGIITAVSDMGPYSTFGATTFYIDLSIYKQKIDAILKRR